MGRSAQNRKRIDLLESVALFSGCTRRDLAAIAGTMDELSVPSGTVMTVEGERGHHFYVLAEGLAGVTAGDTRLGSVLPGTCFGEMALLDGGRRVATVTTELPSRLLVMNAKQFASLMDQPGVARKVLRVLAERLRTVDEQLALSGTS
jgi:CRP-like cAMP-binding protein